MIKRWRVTKSRRRKKNRRTNYKKKKYNTIEEYLEKMLYPTLKIAIKDLINEIKNTNYYKE